MANSLFKKLSRLRHNISRLITNTTYTTTYSMMDTAATGRTLTARDFGIEFDPIASQNGKANGPPGLRVLDENLVNSLIEIMPKNVLRTVFHKHLPKTSKDRQPIVYLTHKEMPTYLKRIISKMRLDEELDPKNRFYLCMAHCRDAKLSYNTTKRYMQLLLRYKVFSEDDSINRQLQRLMPDPLVFRHDVHTRMVDRETYEKFVKYLDANFNRFTAPLLCAVLTGLRTTEILQMTTLHLQQLKNQEYVVEINRKNTIKSDREKQPNHWKPIYTKALNTFIDNLIRLYEPEYSTFQKHNISVLLFLLTPSGLVQRMRAVYYQATKQRLPFGFGIHGNRTTMASLMFNSTNNLISTSKFLQHRHIKSTRVYVRADVINLKKKFDEKMYDREYLRNNNDAYNSYDVNFTNVIDILETEGE